ncbi:MAG: peptide ABC transporter permease, partial [Ignavibacteria bacterium]|nr:peptide ABC transporter permease [Ignavibacteria bacterium]
MTSYFIRRFLLIIPTFFGITLITFLILQFVPGGPIEMEIMKMRMGGNKGSNESGQSGNSTQNNPQSAVDELNKFYGFDKSIHERY